MWRSMTLSIGLGLCTAFVIPSISRVTVQVRIARARVKHPRRRERRSWIVQRHAVGGTLLVRAVIGALLRDVVAQQVARHAPEGAPVGWRAQERSEWPRE